MKTSLFRRAKSRFGLLWGIGFATCAHATVTNVAWYRLGDNDPGAASGQVVNSTTTDFVGVRNLNRFGSPVYTNSVASDAANLSSTLAVRFSGSGQFYSNVVVTTARDNFGIEAWARISPTSEGTYVIAHNGRFALNGWGLIAQVQVVSGRPIIAYSAELGAFGPFGGGISRGGWTHVALVRDNGIGTLYVDGEASGTTNRTPGSPTIGFAIAATPEAPQSAFFPGSIDEVRVFTFAAGQFSTNDLLINQQRAVTLEASDLTITSARLNGSASSAGFDTGAWFEWGTTIDLGNVTPLQAFGSNFTSTNFSEVVTGFTRGGTYYFRAAATNNLGVAFGSIRTVVIGPFVATLPATEVDGTVATLNGVANPKGTDAHAWFEWGTTTNYGNITPPQSFGGGTNDISFSNVLAGLTGETTYQFRAVASNVLGVAFGANLSFTTPAATNMVFLRFDQTATLLPDGKVLFTGGYSPPVNGVSYSSNSAELFDPATGFWAATTPMTESHGAHAATLLPTGKVLVTGATSAEIFDPATETWTTTTSPSVRSAHTATLLRNGKVLLAGNANPSELYDAATASSISSGSMITRRIDHTATLLPNGKVLVVGGLDFAPQQTPLSSAELYDPATGNWENTGGMNLRRRFHTATLLPNGLVLVTGGITVVTNIENMVTNIFSTATNAVEVYNPVTGLWTMTSAMTRGRYGHTATLFADGKLLIAGGFPSGNNPPGAELYDFATGTWTTLPLDIPRVRNAATLLPNGNVLLAGGYNQTSGVPLKVIEFVKPTTPAVWASARPMANRHTDHTATLLLGGQVLVAGAPAAEVYNPALDSWAATGPMTANRSVHTATLLPEGKVLAAGGLLSDFLGNFVPTSSAEVFDPSSRTWQSTAPLSTNRFRHTATLLLNGKVLVAGGLPADFRPPIDTAELFDPPSGKWLPTGTMKNTNHSSHTATLLPNGKVLIAGGGFSLGLGSSTVTSAAELYDPVNGTWTLTGSMTASRTGHKAVLLPNGKVLVAGGSPPGFGPPLQSAELYDPLTGQWKPTGSMATGRALHIATLLPNGTVLVAGGGSSAEIYDPATQLWTATTSNTNAGVFNAAALLLDGRVMDVGDNTNRVRLYTTLIGPSGLFQPVITGLTTTPDPFILTPGGTLGVSGLRFRGVSQGSYGSSKDSSTDYPLVQLRNLESGWSRFLLCTNWSTNSFDSVPVFGFPPGWARVTVFVNALPSASFHIKLGPTILPIDLTEITRSTDGAMQFSFHNTPSAFFTTLAADDIEAPLSNWTPIGDPIEGPPGQYHFTDPQPGSRRFYRVRSP